MNEHETSKPIPENGDPDEDIEIIDVADLIEDDSEIPADDDAEGPSADWGKDRPIDTGSETPLAEEDVFRILDEDSGDVEDEDDEEIIDLVEKAEEDLTTGQEDLADAADGGTGEIKDAALHVADPGLDADLEDDFIAAFDLEEILGADPHAPGGGDLPEDGAEPAEENDLDFIDALDLELNLEDSPPLDSETAPGVESAAAPAPPVVPIPAGTGDAPADIDPEMRLSEQQVEAALERVIRKIYADKIDAILVEAIERTVSEEIGRLKALLNQGASDL